MKKILSILLAACLCSHARAEDNGLSFRDDFDAYRQDIWNETLGKGGVLVSSGSWMRDISVENGVLEIRPPYSQQFLSSNLEYVSATFEVKVAFEKLSGAVPIFYYLGFQSTTDACYFMVQDSALVAVITKAGKNRVAQTCGSVEAGKTYTLKIERRANSIEMFVDGNSVYKTSDANNLTDAPMPVYLAANTQRPADKDGKNDYATAAHAKIDFVEVKELAETSANAPAGGAPSPLVQERTVTIENDKYLASLSLDKGVSWIKLVNKSTGVDYMAGLSGARPIFAIDEDGRRLSSEDFVVEDLKNSGGDHVIRLVNKDKGIKATLTVKSGQGDAFHLGLEVENAGSNARELQTTFPIIGPLSMGGAVRDASYFFPWRTGITGKVDCRLTHEYGNLAWMQVVSMQDAAGKNGLSIFPEDNTGRIKGIHLLKLSGTAPLIKHTENVYHFTPRSPFAFREGLGLSYYYVPRNLAVNEKQVFPSTRLTVYEGGWRRALDDYKAWTRQWYSHVKTPEWFYRVYTLAPKHPPKFWSPTEKKYVNAERDRGHEDMIQWAYWHEYKDRSANPSKNVLENAEYGDYEYNESRGGLKTFVEEIRKLQAKGIRFSVYTDPRFCWQNSKIGLAKGKDWAAMYTPGNYGFYATPDDKWMTSLYEPNGWADYYADMCARIIRDTGMDGIYLDELMIAFPNYNPAHTIYHEGEAPVPVKLLAKNVTKIRDAMQREKPDTIVMVEHAGSDFMTQFVDGSWVQTFYPHAFPFSEQVFDENSLLYFRFLFPEYKMVEYGGGLDAPRRSLFNGVGVDYNSYFDDPEKFATQIALIEKFRPVFHEVADAFAGKNPEMLVPTLHERLLANRFTAGDKQVYTLYNKSGKTVDGAAFRVPSKEGHHLVELIGDTELVAKPVDDVQLEVSLDLPTASVAVVAVLPKLIELKRDGDGFAISVKKLPEGAELLVSTDEDLKGQAIPLKAGQAEVGGKTLEGAKKVIVKVMHEGTLLDQAVAQL